MDIFTIIGGIILLGVILNLRSRVHHLEQFVKISESKRISDIGYKQKEQPSDQKLPEIIQAQQNEKTQQLGPRPFDKFTEWLKEDWLMKLGSLLLLMGFGWFVSYSNVLIGELGQISLGIISGAIFILIGYWRIGKYIHQGGIFLVLGSTIILLTTFAARELYDLFNPGSALAIMFLSTAFVAFASVRYNNRALALSSLILAGIAPLLTNAPTPDYIALFFYLLVVTLGALWIVVLTGRRELTTAALILIGFYSIPHIYSQAEYVDTLLLFAYIFAALFFITNTIGIIKLKYERIVPDLVTAAGNGIFLLFWIMGAAQDEWKSLIIAAWMIIFTIGSFAVFAITTRREPLYVYAGVAIAMLAAATSAELGGATLTIAYTIEAGIISLIAYLLLKDVRVSQNLSLLLIAPIALSFGSFVSRAWETGILHKDFFVLFILGTTLISLGWFFYNNSSDEKENKSIQISSILLIVGSVYFYILLWLSLHAALVNDNVAVTISLAVYTVIGLGSYFYGLANDKKGFRLYGGTLIGFVVGRLIFVDVWDMGQTNRIITFFLIGALLVGTAFFGRKKNNQELPSNVQ